MTTQFDNLPAEAIADEFGSIDAQVKALEARLTALKAELKRRGVDTVQGARYLVTRSDATRWTLDQAAIRDAMGEAWCTKHSKITPVTSFRAKAFHQPAA